MKLRELLELIPDSEIVKICFGHTHKVGFMSSLFGNPARYWSASNTYKVLEVKTDTTSNSIEILVEKIKGDSND